MNCPNDRYVNDARDLPGGRREPRAHRRQDQPRGRDQGHLLPEDPAPRHQLLPARLDAEHRTTRTTCCSRSWRRRTTRAQGQFNLGAYSNPKLDELTMKIQSETDQKKRNEMIREAFKIHQDDVGHIPLHQQALAWAREQEGRADAAAEQLHVLQVDHAEVQVATQPLTGRRSPRRRGRAAGAAPLARRTRRWARFLDGDFWHSLPQLADGDRRGAWSRLLCVVLRGLRQRGRAAQPVRPRDARARATRCCRRPGCEGGTRQVPARHRRPGPRHPLGADVRRAHLARGRRARRCCSRC